ncbi:LacI family DNA-binding transcriptional regulator [Streptomyces brasiliensis]|uniref:LacI family transcriptional regulator n=1 Tax=Streptomyces brasiliensis TaxID=1954 RepID=A0A917UMM9_9ACTN|nr:LacI family DNA-binding transcriptional regulator [Streptomyces brasiliensis]GGJ68360.1 LacI family transcriptional regulator [Streptomyces brasiliensis]
MAGARLKDVAERAGVSIKTVSNVVRGEGRVAEQTRRRVLHAIAELDYQPNASARHLRTGRSGIIALAVPELVAPYFAELAAEVIAAAKTRGCTVLIEDTGGDPAEELRIACGLSDPLIDGVLLSPLGLDETMLANRGRRVPLVLLGEQSYEIPADHVLIDNSAAAREATEHLLRIGRRRIAVIGQPPERAHATTVQRMHGFLTALHAAGVPHDPRLVPHTREFTRADGAAAMRVLLALEDPPDAVFCFSDLLASGAMRAAHEHGLRVPEDLAVVGFDDIQESRYSVPSLTTVSPDKQEIAELAVDAVLHRITNDAEAPHRRLTAGHDLLVRESTGTEAPRT